MSAERCRWWRQRRLRRAGPRPSAGGDGAEHRRPQCHFDLDDGFRAADPAQDDPAATAGGHVSRSPAGHGLAAHRLPGRGERGQVRGGLGAVARRRPHATSPSTADSTATRAATVIAAHTVAEPRSTASDGARRPRGPRATWTCHGPPPSSTRLRPRRGARRHRTATEHSSWFEHRDRPADDVDGQQPHRCGGHLTDRLVAAHRQLDAGTGGCQACRDGPPAVRLAAGGEPDQLAGGVGAAHRRRRGADRAEGERGDQREAAQGERGLDGNRPAIRGGGPRAPDRPAAPARVAGPSEPGRERPLHELGEGGRDRVAGDDAVQQGGEARGGHTADGVFDR